MFKGILRQVWLCCAVALAVALVLYGLAYDHPPADLRYANPSGIHTLDPARMSWTQDLRIALNIWEGLTACDPTTLTPVQGAALFPPHMSADRRTYTFTIRDDARWSNGDPVTAADFIRGWRRGMEPGTATDYTFLFTDHVEGAAAYTAFRRDGVQTLTALTRLADGWAISAEQAKHLARSAVWPALEAHVGSAALDTAEQTGAFDALAKSIASAPIDFAALHAERLFEHAKAMEDVFAGVGLHAPNEKTLVVRLVQPCPYLLDLTAFPTFSPCHVSIERLREGHRRASITREGLVVYDPQWTKPDYHVGAYPGLITNGPYMIDRWTFKHRLRLAVNPHHRRAAQINCRTVDMLVYESIDASIMAYEAGDLDFLTSLDVPYDHEIARLAKSGARPDFHLCTTLATYFLNFNCQSKTIQGRPNPFVDADVRRAFALAVDKTAIVENVLKRGDRVAHSFVPPGAIAGYVPPSGIDHDIQAARAALAEAGYPNGEGFPVVEFLYVPSDQRICQAIANMWETSLGVRVELRGKESKTFAQDKANHRFMIARGNWYGDYNDPTTFLDCLTTGNGNNDSGFSSGAYDKLVRKANIEADGEVRAAKLREAEAMIVEQAFPILPILHYATPIAIKPYVQGLHTNARLWFPFQHVTVSR